MYSVYQDIRGAETRLVSTLGEEDLWTTERWFDRTAREAAGRGDMCQDLNTGVGIFGSLTLSSQTDFWFAEHLDDIKCLITQKCEIILECTEASYIQM